MLFNSIQFLLFFAVFYLVYWNIPRHFRQNALIVGSAIFYGYFSLPFLLHFMVVITINYFLLQRILQDRRFVKGAVILNLFNLGFFKYFYFFNHALHSLTGYPLFLELSSGIRIVLPLAISFYTFQMVAAAIDAGRGIIQKKITYTDYLSFVLFFPVLVAGPILRTTDFFPNLKSLEPEREKTYRAGYLMLSGLIKKMLFADSAALIISPVYNQPSLFDIPSLLLAGLGFTLQVYFDFSGLTDMARSVALFLGIEIPENFKAPFFSPSGSELWRRWHITLSMWLRDYIYFPLGGSRLSEFRTSLNLIITFTLGGFWHGADYTFIVWGVFWGVLLATERFFSRHGGAWLPANRFTHILKILFVMILFSISGLMFRSNSTSSMVDLFVGIFTNVPGYLNTEIGLAGGQWLQNGMELIGANPFRLEIMKNAENLGYMFVIFYLFHYIQDKPEVLEKFRKYDPGLLVVLGIVTIFMIAILSQGGDNFIYYQF